MTRLSFDSAPASFSFSRFGYWSYVDNSGNLWCGQGVWNGDADREREPELKMTGVRFGEFSHHGGLALGQDGSLWAWEQENSPAKLAEKVQTFEEQDAIYYLGEDGLLQRIAWPAEGQDASAPEALMDSVKAFCLNLALWEDGSLWSFGTGENAGPPERLLENIQAISASSEVFAALGEDGRLWLWAPEDANLAGQSSAAPLSEAPEAVRDSVVQVVCGYDGVLLLTENGELWTYSLQSGTWWLLSPSSPDGQ